jgi:hypothetical protein
MLKQNEPTFNKYWGGWRLAAVRVFRALERKRFGPNSYYLNKHNKTQRPPSEIIDLTCLDETTYIFDPSRYPFWKQTAKQETVDRKGKKLAQHTPAPASLTLGETEFSPHLDPVVPSALVSHRQYLEEGQ